jgi:tRNA(Ile)-lysidine synthase
LDRNGLEAVLVAHHADDQLETIFLNLLRGTGLEGVYGMADVRGHVVRPLLPFSKGQIREYMEKNEFPWREDQSNAGNDYKRNLLRNELLPGFERELPGSLRQMASSFQRLKDTGRAFFSLYEDWKKYHVKSEEGFQYLAIQDIANHPGRLSMLYYWIRDFGFSMYDAEEIIAAVDGSEAGKSFFSGGFMLNRDRDFLIIGKTDFKWQQQEIGRHDISCQLRDINYDILKLQVPLAIDTSSENAMFDLEKLVFPLLIRKWEYGDRIAPLGLDREKKVSDLLVDLKIPLIRKKQVLVMVSGEEIAWVVGLRISERFKIDNRTSNVLYFKKTQQ